MCGPQRLVGGRVAPACAVPADFDASPQSDLAGGVQSSIFNLLGTRGPGRLGFLLARQDSRWEGQRPSRERMLVK